MQYPLLKSILILVQIITQYFGDYCESSWSFHHAHLYLTIIDYVFVGGALGATIRFARRVGSEIDASHKGRAKIWSFLGILIFQLIQNVSHCTPSAPRSSLTILQLIFHVLNGKLFSPTDKATYNDINFGIASFMTCIEAVVFSFIFHWSFSSGEYKEGQRTDRLGLGPAQRTSTFRAILDALNLSDIVAGSVLAFQILFMRVKTRYGSSTGGPQRQRTLKTEEQIHLEPRRNYRELGNPSNSEYDTQYGGGYSPPPMPPNARDPSPGAAFGRAQTFRGDGLRPDLARQDSYSRRGYSRNDSPPETQPLRHPQDMIR